MATKFATYEGVLVEVLSERSITGGVACDVRVVGALAPWTVREFTTNRDHLTFDVAADGVPTPKVRRVADAMDGLVGCKTYVLETDEGVTERWMTEQNRKKLADGGTLSCRISIFTRDGARFLSSYGGDVWPSAWPFLFVARRPSVQGAGHDITPEGLRLLTAADEAVTV